MTLKVTPKDVRDAVKAFKAIESRVLARMSVAGGDKDTAVKRMAALFCIR